MSEVTNTAALNQQAYNVHGGESLVTQVDRAMCILLPRGVIIAGFSDRGDLLMIRSNDYKKTLPAWILDFFEHQFINEPLLANPAKVTAAFVAADKYLLVPDILYNEQAAEKWMKKIDFIEGNEVIGTQNLREDNAYYLFAWPAAIKSLLARYFTKAKVLPLASYQFYKPYKQECSLQCCITPDQVYATLYNNRSLHWHQVFDYEVAEDIAYRLKLLCKQHNIESDYVNMQCTVTGKSLLHIANELGHYFPNMKDGTGNVNASDRNWTSTIYLLQQLYACAL
jgi:hypothetical protein